MKQPLDAFLGQLKGASLAAKLALACGVLALAGVVAVATQWADKPNFVLLASNLDARTSAAVQSALATAGVRYQASQPPGPFVVHVDEEQYYMAQNAIALGGALDTPPSGIRTDQSGASSVFLSASERAQSALKREWQEMESQLEALDFVERARVSTSTPDRSPLRRDKSITRPSGHRRQARAASFQRAERVGDDQRSIRTRVVGCRQAGRGPHGRVRFT